MAHVDAVTFQDLESSCTSSPNFLFLQSIGRNKAKVKSQSPTLEGYQKLTHVQRALHGLFTHYSSNLLMWRLLLWLRDMNLQIRLLPYRHICMYAAMKCINEEISLLAIAISSTFSALKTTVLTTLSTNSRH